MTFLFQECPYLLLFIPEVVAAILLSCFYMSNVPTCLCHILISPFKVAQPLLVADRRGEWGSYSLWVLERIVDIIYSLGSDVLSHYGSEMVPSVKLPYSRPEMTMVANHPFWEKQNLRKTGRKENALILLWGRDEGWVTLRSSSMDWHCIWPLRSHNPVSLKANLWMFNQTVLVPSNLDMGVSWLWKFTWNSVRCYCGGVGMSAISPVEAGLLDTIPYSRDKVPRRVVSERTFSDILGCFAYGLILIL